MQTLWPFIVSWNEFFLGIRYFGFLQRNQKIIANQACLITIYFTFITKVHKAKSSRFCVFGFNDKRTKVELKHAAEKDATFKDLLAQLPMDHVRFIFYDCRYKTKEGQDRDKVSSDYVHTWSFHIVWKRILLAIS